jgi:chorismate synthase
MNSFGKNLVLTTFGESHGPAVGGILDGFPSDFPVDMDFIQSELDRRAPGRSSYSSARKEKDRIVILSGLFQGRTTGAPVAFLVNNEDARPEDYSHLEKTFRPSHADYTWTAKFGIRDFRGGGRASARETLARVAGGAFAKLFLKKAKIGILGFVSQVGEFMVPEDFVLKTAEEVSRSPVLCPHPATSKAMEKYLADVKAGGDSAGGVVTCLLRGVPAGLGEPVFDKLQASLAHAMLSIPGAKGFDYGTGFRAPFMKGSEHNDLFVIKRGRITTATNRSGGIQGGISNGNEICFRVAFKPAASIMKDQLSVDQTGKAVVIKGKGRHDVCYVPRAVPVVEAMAALVLADHLLISRK